MPDSSATRLAAAALALLLAGCPSGPDPRLPPDFDLSAARRLESQGKTLDAIVEYARLVDDLNRSGRVDIRAQTAWARILGSLYRLKLGEALAQAPPAVKAKCASLEPWCSPPFLSAGAAGHWIQVLNLGAEPAAMAEAAASVAESLSEKLEQRPLRRGRLEPEGDVSERLYRRYLAEGAAGYARYAVSRTIPKTPEAVARAADPLRRLARELRELSALPGVRPGPAARWAERATEADAAAITLTADRTGANVPLANDLRLAVEQDANGLLKTAIDHANKANDLLSRRAAEEEILDALERSLQCFTAARECLVEPSVIQKRTLDVMSIAADTLRSLAFQN
jgi:hypothetical protein